MQSPPLTVPGHLHTRIWYFDFPLLVLFFTVLHLLQQTGSWRRISLQKWVGRTSYKNERTDNVFLSIDMTILNFAEIFQSPSSVCKLNTVRLLHGQKQWECIGPSHEDMLNTLFWPFSSKIPMPCSPHTGVHVSPDKWLLETLQRFFKSFCSSKVSSFTPWRWRRQNQR